MSRRDAAWMADILVSIDAISDYLAEGSLDQPVVYDACRVRLIEIGEAVKNIDPACSRLLQPSAGGPSPGCATNSPTTTSTPTTPSWLTSFKKS